MPRPRRRLLGARVAAAVAQPQHVRRDRRRLPAGQAARGDRGVREVLWVCGEARHESEAHALGALAQELDLSHNNISKMSGLEGLKQLKKLNLGNNEITSIEGLEGLTSLETLQLQACAAPSPLHPSSPPEPTPRHHPPSATSGGSSAWSPP